MRVLIATKIFPSARNPSMAPYNRHQFVALSRLCRAHLFVSLPWFPGESLVARLRGRPQASTASTAEVDGLRYRQARVFYVPKLGQAAAGLSYALSLAPHALKLRGEVDVVLGAFAYPDGFAAVLLGKLLGVPAVIKLHGSDVNVISKSPLLRPLLAWGLSQAAAVVGPSQPLVDQAIALGADPRRARRILNGVDKALFRPQNKSACRAALGISSPKRWLLFVGLMVDAKGCADLLAAFRELSPALPDVELVMVGDGPELARYRADSADLPVRFTGRRSHEEIATWIGASDVVTLPSWAEGTPNVVIEAIVSGRPVVASDVGGIPAVLNRAELGQIVPAQDRQALAAALRRVLAQPHAADQIAELAGFGDWDHSARELLSVLEAAVSEHNLRTGP